RGGDIVSEAPRRAGHAPETREALHVDHVGSSTALHDVHAEQVDAERRAATTGEVRELAGEGKQRALRLAAQHAKELAADRVDLAWRPVQRMIALGEDRLLDRPQRRELRRVPHDLGTRAVRPRATVRLDDQRAAVEGGEELARVGRDQCLGYGHARGLQY